MTFRKSYNINQNPILLLDVNLIFRYFVKIQAHIYNQRSKCEKMKKKTHPLRNRDNEFHGAAYTDYRTGKLKHAFTGVVQKPSRGTEGQIEAFVECISNLYPESNLVKPEDVFRLFREERESRIEIYKSYVDEILDSVPDENMPAPGFHEGIEINLDKI